MMPEHSLLLKQAPQEWVQVTFDDVVDRVSDTTMPSPNGKRLYLGLEHLASGRPALIGMGKESDVKSGKTEFRAGDILFGKLRPYLRKSVIAPASGICSTDILVFRATARANAEFVSFLAHSNEFIRHARATTSGVQHPRTSWASLREFELHLPPLEEQHKIAAALGLVQQAIEQQEQLIALATELKNVFLQKVFSEGLHGETQKESEIGPLPQNWKVEELGKVVAEIDYGISAPIPKTPPDGGIKVVSTADITKDGRLLYSQIRKIKAPDGTTRRLTLRTGDVLFNWRNSAELIGKTAVFVEQDEPHIFASFILRIRCDEIKTHNHFIANLMNYFRGQSVFLKLARRAVNQANYNRNEISILKIPIPPFSEQCEIAASISVIDGRINFYRSRHLILTELFHSLLHQLMTAQIRVHDLELPKSKNTAAA